MPNQTKPVDTSELMRMLSQGLKQHAKKPNIHGYVPHEKQCIFHKYDKYGRLYIGGNRSGKTYSSVVEDIWWLLGTHPYLITPEPPVRGRVVCVDFIEGLEQIILPLFKSLLPSSALIDGSWEKSYSKSLRLLTLSNGSTVEFMSYEQDTEKFAGTSRHFIHFDEEPPMHIWQECLARLVDTDGNWWISMTPVEGLTWTFEKIYKPGTDNPEGNIGIVEADMQDNPHISKEAAEQYLSTLDEDDRKAREHGKYVQLGGLVYKKFSKKLHVVESRIPPKDWTWYCSLDHGYNNPTAVLWHAVSPLNYVLTFSEWYEREKTLDEVAAAIHLRNSELIKLGGKLPDYYVADPAIAQRSAHNGTSIQTEYAIRGIGFLLGVNDVQVGIAKIQNYLRISKDLTEATGAETPFYQITENCANYIAEMQKLRWKTFASKKMVFNNNPQEQVHKKDDHACDSARYFFSFLPVLAPTMFKDQDEPPKEPGPNDRAGLNIYNDIDSVLAKMGKSQVSVDTNGRGQTTWSNEVVGTELSGLEYD